MWTDCGTCLGHGICRYSREYLTKILNCSCEYLSMVFDLSQAKMEILRELTKQDWTPTDLAEKLGKSNNTIYNHLSQLYEDGVLSKKSVSAKTRPKTQYSIDDGFIQYIAVLPGQLTEQKVHLTPRKEAMFRIWSVPQDEFHPYIEDYWHQLRMSDELNVEAVGIYGSVARGTADEDSDIDIIVVTDDDDPEQINDDLMSSVRVTTDSGSRIFMNEIYTEQEYRDSVAHGSSFLENIRDEIIPIYDPDQILTEPANVIQ